MAQSTWLIPSIFYFMLSLFIAHLLNRYSYNLTSGQDTNNNQYQCFHSNVRKWWCGQKDWKHYVMSTSWEPLMCIGL